MANQVMIDELKVALMAARPEQLNSHSTLKACEALLQCLRRDGVMAGSHGGGAGSYGGGAGAGGNYPELHYGMNYVDGGKSSGGGYAGSTMSHGQKVELGRHTEGYMKGSSWSTNY